MTSGTAKIDLHGLTVMEAEYALGDFLDNLSGKVHTVHVIHGVGSGALKNMVAGFYHRRICDKAHCIGNAGQTNLYINLP